MGAAGKDGPSAAFLEIEIMGPIPGINNGFSRAASRIFFCAGAIGGGGTP